MSCTPTSHLLDRSLSPSDESRFVPHSSVRATSSVMEKHFPTTPTQRRNTETEEKEPALVEEEGGIVGATICFTPQSSPGVSPRVERTPVSPARENYIGELKLGSSIMRVASSLDNRSITEYEMLDELQSRVGSVQVEDLELSEEVDEVVASATGNVGVMDPEREDVPLDGSLGRLLDSLPLLTPEAVSKDPPERPVSRNDGLIRDLTLSDEGTAFSRMTKSMLFRMSKSGKLDVWNVEPDGDISNASSSPKVDDTPLRTLKNLKAFWESRVFGQDVEETVEEENDPKPSPNQSAHQELDVSISSGAKSQTSGTSSKSSSRRQAAASLLSVVGGFVSLCAQRLAFVCAFSLKKILEQVCHVLARSIISMTATRVEHSANSTENVTLEEPYVDIALDSTRVNLSALFSETGVPDQTKTEENQSKTFAVGWKSIAATSLSVLVMASLLLVRLFAANDTLSNESSQDVCITTNSTSFDSVPIWEVNLAPTEGIHMEMPVGSSLPRLAFIASIVIAFLAAYVFHSDLLKVSVKKRSKHLSGIWSPREHEQFLEGYRRHGARWELVAKFVPTRNYEQVQTHARHWIRVGSPEVMKRTRKTTLDTTSKSPKSVDSKVGAPEVIKSSGKVTLNTTPKPTKSAVSTQTTPKLFNMATLFFAGSIKEPESEHRDE